MSPPVNAVGVASSNGILIRKLNRLCFGYSIATSVARACTSSAIGVFSATRHSRRTNRCCIGCRETRPQTGFSRANNIARVRAQPSSTTCKLRKRTVMRFQVTRRDNRGAGSLRVRRNDDDQGPLHFCPVKTIRYIRRHVCFATRKTEVTIFYRLTVMKTYSESFVLSQECFRWERHE